MVGIGVNDLEFSEKNVGQVSRSKNLLVQEHACSKSSMLTFDLYVCVVLYVLDARTEHTGHRQHTAEGHRGDMGQGCRI